jgi:hypothetical protein
MTRERRDVAAAGTRPSGAEERAKTGATLPPDVDDSSFLRRFSRGGANRAHARAPCPSSARAHSGAASTAAAAATAAATAAAARRTGGPARSSDSGSPGASPRLGAAAPLRPPGWHGVAAEGGRGGGGATGPSDRAIAAYGRRACGEAAGLLSTSSSGLDKYLRFINY